MVTFVADVGVAAELLYSLRTQPVQNIRDTLIHTHTQNACKDRDKALLAEGLSTKKFILSVIIIYFRL